MASQAQTIEQTIDAIMENEPFAGWLAQAAANPPYTPLLDLDDCLQERNAGHQSSSRGPTQARGRKSTSVRGRTQCNAYCKD